MLPHLVLSGLLACNPALAALFTPTHPQLGRYTVCTTTAPIEAAMAEAGSGPGGEPHYGTSQAVDALDAFGTAGPYDRSGLARLYGGRRARVVRGWAEHDGRFEMITLISPHPDAALEHLMEGTMVIRWVE
jgi:hypothetical protein